MLVTARRVQDELKKARRDAADAIRLVASESDEAVRLLMAKRAALRREVEALHREVHRALKDGVLGS